MIFPPRFSTPRLRAETLDERHLPGLTELHLDPEAALFLGGVRSAETTRAYLNTSLDHWAHHGFGLFALLTREGAFAGRAGVRHVVVGEAPEIEIAYAFAKPFWGQGLASEIARRLTALAVERLRPPSLVGVVMIGNHASCRVLEKTGFAYESEVIFHNAVCRLHRLRTSSEDGGRSGQDAGFSIPNTAS